MDKDISEPTSAVTEYHGLDNETQVFFYEQDFYVLSNFSSFTLVWKNIRFDTLEAAYHWEKFVSQDDDDDHLRLVIQESIRTAPSAHVAFQIAQKHKALRRPDWDNDSGSGIIKVNIMLSLLCEKVKQHDYVKQKLLATGDRRLVENSWRDTVWGWGPNRDGQNLLGECWMKVRQQLIESPWMF